MNEEICQQIEAQSCIIIHPGSKYLRIGRPSDSIPYTILHAIACRKKDNLSYNDSYLIPPHDIDKDITQEIEECRLKISHILQSSLTSDGTRRFATPPQQVATFNKRCEPVTLDKNEATSKWISSDKEFIIGDEILTLKPGSHYNIHYPYKRGDLNIHTSVGGSLSAVLSHLEIIWGYSISTFLSISLKDLKFYRAVLIIPDIYNREHVKKLVNLLLCDLGFGGCFIIQDHVAATFGAGLASACVVDVGDQKTSISCVEDAISHQTTRIRLDYGGGDITHVFNWLLKKCSFPYNFDLRSTTDVTHLYKLKHDFCHINLDICGSQEKEFILNRPDMDPLSYNVQMGDELIIAPLSYFYPDLLRLTGSKVTITQRPNIGDPDDPLDENFLRETSRMKGREASEMMDMSGFDPIEGEYDVIDENNSTTAFTGSNSYNKSEASMCAIEKLLSIEQAILTSIERCPNEEMKRKMYTCILVVGGGAKFENFGKWLYNRLNLQVPLSYRSEQIEVITKPKDLDSSITVWKGASLMTCLEGSSELWILKGEWVRQGLKILREKCPLLW